MDNVLLDPQMIAIAAMVGYFLSKIMEWGKNSDWVKFINPDTTYLVQFLTALISFLINFAGMYFGSDAFNWTVAATATFNALVTWIAAEIAYHKTIKNPAVVQIVNVNDIPKEFLN